MSPRSGSTRWLWTGATVVVVAVGVGVGWRLRPTAPVPPAEAPPRFPLPAFHDSEYRNVGPEARYIGSAACAECHPRQHASYCLTMHSRALSDIRPEAEPPDGVLEHRPSGRTYAVFRRDGQLFQSETLTDEQGRRVAHLELPLRYLIGSGHFCRTYIVEVDGFLHEAPLTWYTSRQAWDMSPGYDFPHHWSFERPILHGCLNCHAGRFEPVGGTVHKARLLEQAIGCERCHGPGSLHAERYRQSREPLGDDRTIVQPARLPRPLLEAICAECHLSGVAAVLVRGRGPQDFRPGRPLTDYRIDFRFEGGHDQMTVVGHIEQLRASVCYQKASHLTCLTCHDPHAARKPADPDQHYRAICIRCHSSPGCSIDEATRRRQARDLCTTCHMPRGNTDIPHIAFTHHRIGRHGRPAPASAPQIPALVPIDDSPLLTDVERHRLLALAYMQLARNPQYERLEREFRRRAARLLEQVHEAGLRDAATTQALAELYWLERDFVRTRPLAEEALTFPQADPEVYATALLLAADCDFQDGFYRSAIARLEQVVRLRRTAEDWRLLGVSLLLDGQPDRALIALQTGLAVRPTRPDIHGALFELYRRIGDPQRAKEHFDKAQWLERKRQQ